MDQLNFEGKAVAEKATELYYLPENAFVNIVLPRLEEERVLRDVVVALCQYGESGMFDDFDSFTEYFELDVDIDSVVDNNPHFEVDSYLLGETSSSQSFEDILRREVGSTFVSRFYTAVRIAFIKLQGMDPGSSAWSTEKASERNLEK